MSARAPTTITFTVWGPVQRSDLPGLCDRVCQILGAVPVEIAYCDVCSVPADAVTVDALCRLQVAAQRVGCRVRLRNASDELRRLVDFMGLTEVVTD